MIEQSIQLYRTMYLIRRTEEVLIEHYSENEMKTPTHLSLGEEAIVAGLVHALAKHDQVLGTYRSHALYLAKTGETQRFFGEMYGKVSGTAKGKAGSMHLTAPQDGLIATSAIVASCIPVALGAAYANKMKGNGKIVAVFFGDGAIDEGVFWESLNAASQMELPVLLVCEDNGYAVHSPTIARHGYDNIAEVVSRFRCNIFQSHSTDVEELWKIGVEARRSTMETGQPSFLHLHYYRYLEHVGVNEDFQAGYRSRSEFEEWLARDPLKIQRQRLLATIPEEEVKSLEEDIERQILTSLEHAREAPFPGPETLQEDVFS